MSVQIGPAAWVDFALDSNQSTHPADLAQVSGEPSWRRAEMLTARGLLRSLLKEVAPACADARLGIGISGKPFLVGWSKVGVSWSHDGDAVAVAVSLGREVGVDVQLPIQDPSELVLRRCLRERLDEMLSLPDAERALEFAWIWSVQEACVKCDGSGISGRPWEIDVPLRPQTGEWRSISWRTLRHKTSLPVSCALGEVLC